MREARASGDAAAATEFDWFCVPDRENPDNFGLRCVCVPSRVPCASLKFV